MKKQYLPALIMITVAGAAIFGQDILAIFRGMSPLEMLQTLITYLLHIAIGTVAAVVIFGLPKIVQPWTRTLRWKQRQERRGWRSGPNAQWQQTTPRIRMPRLNATLTLPSQKRPATFRQAQGTATRIPPAQDGGHLKIKW